MPQLLKGIHPRAYFLHQPRIVRLGTDDGRSGGHTGKFLFEQGRILLLNLAFPGGFQHALDYGLYFHGFLTPVAVTVRALVGVVVHKNLHGFRRFREQAPDSFLPGLIRLEPVDVPGVVRKAEEGDLGGLRLIHGVGDETAHGFLRSRFRGKAIHAAHAEVGTAVVRDGEVPPDVGRALDSPVHPLLAFQRNVMANGVPRPHDVDGGVQTVPQNVQIGSRLGIGPAAVVLRGAHDQGGDVLLHLDKFVIDLVQQKGLHVPALAFAEDIVKKHGKGTDAQLVHHLKLFDDVVHVFFRPLDIFARMDGPHKIHVVFLCHLHQFPDLGGLVRGIGVPPVGGRVVGIVLRPVDVCVHLVLAVKAQLAQTGFMAPGGAVKTFHRSAEFDVRPVYDFPNGQNHAFPAGLRSQLPQRLHGVKRPPFVMGSYAHLSLRRNHQFVGSGFLRNSLQQLAAARLGGTYGHGRLPGESNRLGGKFGLLGRRIYGRSRRQGGTGQKGRHAQATLEKLKTIHDDAR